MTEKIVAPFSDEQVVALNYFQKNNIFHAFTCGGDRGNAAHIAYAETHGDRDEGLLVATGGG